MGKSTGYEETSFWAKGYGPYEPSDPLRGHVDADVAVIGAGFTGLNVAREVAASSPGATVAVLEAAVVGFGASGRNGGFSMTLFGLEPELTALRWGRERLVDAHRYMQRAVAFVRELVERHELDSDYEHTGFVRVSYTDAQLRRLQKTHALYRKLGLDGDMRMLSAEELRGKVKTSRYVGGLFERETGIMDPCKHVRELKRLAEEAGVLVFERSPVTAIRRETGAGGVRLSTPEGSVRAGKVVLATNAYTRLVPGVSALRNAQLPVWTYQVVTERLDKSTWRALGWEGRESFEDNRQLIHYFRRTADGRITMGGGDVGLHFDGSLDHDASPSTWAHLQDHLRWLFPQLRDVRFDYRWGGPVSVNPDMTPEIGFLGDERVVYSTGCIGHGVSMCHLNGRLIADLVTDRKTELTDFWIVNRRAIPWPGDTLSRIGAYGIHGALRAWDRFEERRLARSDHPTSSDDAAPSPRSRREPAGKTRPVDEPPARPSRREHP